MFVQFINGDFLSLYLCRRAHYCFHGLDSSNLFSMSSAEVLPVLHIWTDTSIFSKITAQNEMCTESECGSSSSALDLGMTSRGMEVPRTVVIQPARPSTLAWCKLRRRFSGALFPLGFDQSIP